MNGFVRATHDENNRFRIEMQEVWDKYTQQMGGIFHWLIRQRPTTFAQLIDILNKDETNWPNGAPPLETVSLMLISAIECDAVRVCQVE